MLDFVRLLYPKFIPNWHHERVCEALDRVARGETKRLMLFMPPRYWKSQLVSRVFPAYILGVQPAARIISTSYSSDLSSRMNRDVQRIIDSDDYRAAFPNTKLSGRNVRTLADGSYLRNSDIFEIVGGGGSYRSAGVGGGITGMGYDYGIIDDPFKNRMEANSPTLRNAIWEWYTSTFYTRQEDDAAILLCMTRWDRDDLAGRLLKAMGEASDGEEVFGERWEILNFPAIAEAPIPDYDPREEGDPLWLAKHDLPKLERIRRAIGAHDFGALFQQHPTAREGGLFKWKDIDDARKTEKPVLKRIVVAIDPAVTATANSDETGIVVAGIGIDGHGYVLEDVSLSASPDTWARQAVSAYRKWSADRLIAEVNNGGDMVELTIRTADKNVPITQVRASRGKVTRAEPIAALYEQGKVHHVGYHTALEDQMCSVIDGSNSPDRVDALVWALSDLMLKPDRFFVA